MKIQWVEDICNKGGVGARDRKLMRKLADEIYRLNSSQAIADENTKLYERCLSTQTELDLLKLENSILEQNYQYLKKHAVFVDESEPIQTAKKKSSRKSN